MFHVKYTLYRKCETYIPRNDTAQPKRQRKGKTDTFFSGFLRTVEMTMQTFGQNADKILTSVGHFFRQRFSLGYWEYWMIYRGAGFLVDVWLGSSLTPTPSPCFKLSLFLSLPVVLTDGKEGMKGAGEEPNHTPVRTPGRLSIIQYSCLGASVKLILGRNNRTV